MSRKKTEPEKRTFFSKLLFSFLVLITVTVITVSSILYVNFEKIAAGQVNSYVTDNLLKLCSGTQFMTDWVKLMLIQMYRDTDIRSILFKNSPDPVQVAKGSTRLTSYQASSPFFRSIYLYNGGIEKIYFAGEHTFVYDRENFHDQEIFSYLTGKKQNHLVPIPRIITGNAEGTVTIEHNVFSFIMFDNPASESTYPNAIVLNFSEDLLKEIMKTFYPEKKGDVIVIDKTGNTMIGTRDYPFLTNIGKRDFVKKVLEAENKMGSFSANLDGKKYLITFVYPEAVIPEDYRLNWRYISVIPYSDVISGIQKMRRNTLIFLLLFLSVGIPVIIFLSRKLSAPVSKLEIEKKKNQRHLKNSFLRRLLHGEEQHSEQELSVRFQKHGLKIALYDHFLLFLLRIDDYNSFRDQYSSEDREEKKQAVITIIENALPGQSYETVDTEDDTIAVITADEKPLLQKIRQEVKDSLSISVSITCADGGEAIVRDIDTVYTEAMDVSWNRYFEGRGCILDCRAYRSKPSSEYDYPYEKEKQFTELLLMNRLRESRTVFREILGTCRGYSQTVFQTALQRLVLSVYSALDRYRKNSAAGVTDNIKSPLSSLFACDTVTGIEEQLFPYLAETIPLFQVKKESSHNQLVGDIIEDIKRNYPDPQLCAEHYADKYSLSTVYLGRLFKQHTTKSISEFINHVRVDAAKNLLTTTGDPVNDIVKMVGFTYPNYFFSIFKKYNGVTPLEYRQKHHDPVETLNVIK